MKPIGLLRLSETVPAWSEVASRQDRRINARPRLPCEEVTTPARSPAALLRVLPGSTASLLSQ